ncbi:hypothetical protein Moror_1414 [Moniliophthora roreri MCA 2997]|uniref:Uncharacterized protein n=2 Tax=Moniliophthora roreri TaxID=221103 RepID=V2XLK3_MONRO|nr:hypothetical protein Moror_1414 [Moniliophthora roreri MCA 2997]KAI3596795.1 hypothetical protein WG66_016392 [Moniliophthora roreri]
MFSGLQGMAPNDTELATQTLAEEGSYRFPSFSASDAVTLGLSLRKRFRSTSRHSKGKGMVISIQTIAGHTLFSCTVGDLGHFSGIGDVSLDSWSFLEGMINVVKRTGHSSFYVEKAMSAMGRSAKHLFEGQDMPAKVQGGAFPIWLENAHCCPIAVVACYSGSSQEDHHLVVTSVRDYINKMLRNSAAAPSGASVAPSMPAPSVSHRPESGEWAHETATSEYTSSRRPETPYDRHEDEH